MTPASMAGVTLRVRWSRTKFVVGEVQGDGRAEVLNLPARAVGESGEPAHGHSHGERPAFDVGFLESADDLYLSRQWQPIHGKTPRQMRCNAYGVPWSRTQQPGRKVLTGNPRHPKRPRSAWIRRGFVLHESNNQLDKMFCQE